MEIESFLSFVKRPLKSDAETLPHLRSIAKSFFHFLLVLVLGFSLVSCSSLKTRDKLKKEQIVAPEPIEPIKQPEVAEEVIPVAGPELIEQDNVPKVGVILGPGGMKAFAHLGVLQSLVKARVPIDYIVGIGWGAPIAALYAAQGQVFDAEWKMLKLDTSLLPGKGILTKSIKPGSVDLLDPFLEQAFTDLELETSKVPFGCPIRSVYSDEVRWIESGRAKAALKPCLAALPYFLSRDRQIPALGAISEASSKLREMGAEIVIFVDVLRAGPIIDKDRVEDELVNHIMWTEIRHSLRKQASGINEVIALQSREYGVISSEEIRQLVRLGKNTGKEAAEKFVSKYGF